jgi:hypothetical protein
MTGSATTAGTNGVTGPTVTVVCSEHRPPRMGEVEGPAVVRYATADEQSGALRGADPRFVWDFQSDAVAGSWHAADRSADQRRGQDDRPRVVDKTIVPVGRTRAPSGLA